MQKACVYIVFFCSVFVCIVTDFFKSKKFVFSCLPLVRDHTTVCFHIISSICMFCTQYLCALSVCASFVRVQLSGKFKFVHSSLLPHFNGNQMWQQPQVYTFPLFDSIQSTVGIITPLLYGNLLRPKYHSLTNLSFVFCC